MRIPIFILFCLQVLHPQAQDDVSSLRKGNSFYRKGQMEAAVASYTKAADGKFKYIALLNKGNALYKQKKYEDAIKTFRLVSESKSAEPLLKSGAYYNIGVVYSSQKKLQESIVEYTKALLLNENDQNARENLQKALMELKQNKAGGSQNQQQKNTDARLNKNQAQQQLNKLEQKEKNTHDKMTKDKSQYGGNAGKDW